MVSSANGLNKYLGESIISKGFIDFLDFHYCLLNQ